MAGMTNRGKKVMLNAYFTADTTDEPTAFKMALVTSATAPTQDTNVLTDLTEITAGNGYTAGGLAIARSAVGFDVITEEDTSDYGAAQMADIVWTATGGPIPSAGGGARYAVLLDDAATPNILAYFDLTTDRTVSDTQTLTLADFDVRLTQT